MLRDQITYPATACFHLLGSKSNNLRFATFIFPNFAGPSKASCLPSFILIYK
ncbi:hypothetical protein M404DRAFT_725011 [Pisolithus tinctorius Marx 270]|uniref:Uncharacterized protein n=1 Tax=Pisolithus tinctorius Marx 270 TaxID=870435 RepID=A0A0C3P399_PISTI|nr:hypothetical protein M404DRAFT_725011 [Pisolithus tinctorius Marx 270]